MKKVILGMVFVFATGIILSANQKKNSKEVRKGSCFDMANATETNFCGSNGCSDAVWEAAYDGCRAQF